MPNYDVDILHEKVKLKTDTGVASVEISEKQSP
jgi:hypothetical protein